MHCMLCYVEIDVNQFTCAKKYICIYITFTGDLNDTRGSNEEILYFQAFGGSSASIFKEPDDLVP